MIAICQMEYHSILAKKRAMLLIYKMGKRGFLNGKRIIT